MYVATINIPGYLPMDDDPPVFDTAREAWEYLADERRRSEDETPASGYTDTVAELDRHADARWLVCDFERAGTVYGATPGYDGDHDLGLAYSVTETEDES